MGKDAEFPEWRGYEDLEKMKQFISYGCYNDPKQILEYAAKMTLERIYFKDLILFVQNKLDRHIFLEEPLGLCIDSSSEIFEGIMIIPCERIKEDEEKT